MARKKQSQNTLKPNKSQAERFLALLDPEAAHWNFIGFNDDKRDGAPQQPRIATGSLDECWDSLVSWNLDGYSVCVMINESKPRRFKKSDITRIRAVWREVDERGAPDLPLEPTMTVRTSAAKYKKHEYYVLDDGNSLSHAEAEAIQCDLASRGGDTGSREIAHKLRVPGFFHQKLDPDKGLDGTPFHVHLSTESCLVYSKEELLEAFGSNLDSTADAPGTAIATIDGLPEGDDERRVSPWRNPLMVLRIKNYLKYIDPDCSHEDWIMVGMAIHAQGLADGEGNRYFRLWHQWSRQSSSFVGIDDDKKRWKSFRRGKVNIGSLINLAKKNIEYKDPAPYEYLAAINDFCALMESGGKIKVVYNWNRPEHVLVLGRDDAAVLLTPHAWKNHEGKLVDPMRVWIQSNTARLVKGLRFMPDSPPGIVSDYVNTYQGDGRSELVTSSSASCALYLEHVRENICAGRKEVFEWLLDWIAHMIQFPGEKPSVAVVMRGREGVGKGVFMRAIRTLVGENNYAQFTSAEQLMNKFNAHIHENICVFADEVIWGGDKKHRGLLYSLISEPQVTVERKFMSPLSMRSCVRLGIATNEFWAAPTTLDARRFLILDVLDDRKDDYKYFGEVIEQLEAGGYAKLYDILRERPIKKVLPPRPTTAETSQQKLLSLTSLHSWWHECIQEGKVVGYYAGGEDGWPEWIPTQDFWEAYGRWCKDNGARRVSTSTQALMSHLKDVLPHGEALKRSRKRKFNAHCYGLEDLESYADALKELGLD